MTTTTSPVALRTLPNELARRSARVVTMLGELHKAGFQRLRGLPYMSPSGHHWRLEIGPASLFLRSHGALLVSSDALHPSLNRNIVAMLEGTARYTSGQATEAEFFGWTDARNDGARELAAKFLNRFPALAEAGKGWDHAYAGWWVRVMGAVEQGVFPIAFDDWNPPSRHGLGMTLMRPAEWAEAPVDAIPLPPPGEFDDGEARA
ncbi:hypothetical protein ACFQS7_26725 [Dankookia sp. GCM10030260]|uniref:hypothetical protein n=1 Tax=Dankookia sp. GCM10030260 TaxID=3273390 RepID=UPI0036169614